MTKTGIAELILTHPAMRGTSTVKAMCAKYNHDELLTLLDAWTMPDRAAAGRLLDGVYFARRTRLAGRKGA